MMPRHFYLHYHYTNATVYFGSIYLMLPDTGNGYSEVQ